MTQDRGTDALLSSIDWLRRAVQEMGERNQTLENEMIEERIRSQQLARDCQSDLRRLREEKEKTEARVAQLEAEAVERSHELLGLKAELSSAVQKALQLREQASGMIRAEREQMRQAEAALRGLEQRSKDLGRARIEAEEQLLARDRTIEQLKAELAGQR